MKLSKRLTQQVEDILKDLGPGAHPFRTLLMLSLDQALPASLRIEAAAKALPFCASRLQSTEVHGPNGEALQGPTLVDNLNVIATLYSAQHDPERRTQLLQVLNALPPAREQSHDD